MRPSEGMSGYRLMLVAENYDSCMQECMFDWMKLLIMIINSWRRTKTLISTPLACRASSSTAEVLVD